MGYYGDKRLWTKVKRERKKRFREGEVLRTTCRKCGRKDKLGLIDGLCSRCF